MDISAALFDSVNNLTGYLFHQFIGIVFIDKTARKNLSGSSSNRPLEVEGQADDHNTVTA